MSTYTPWVARLLLVAVAPGLVCGVAGSWEGDGVLAGEEPPGTTPEIFAPGVISKAGFHLHSSLAFAPGGEQFCFTKIVFDPAVRGTIWCSTRGAGGWGEPAIPSFSGTHNDDSAVFSPDGKALYFCSSRPCPGPEDDQVPDLNLWLVRWQGDGWADPIPAGDAVNSDHDDFRLSFAADGTMYLSSDRRGWERGTFDIFVSEPGEDGYTEPRPIGKAVNTPVTEQIAFVAPDEGYLVFYRHDRNRVDETGLYISFRDSDGAWTAARPLGALFNSPPEAITQAASLSPDQRYVFFLRRRHEAIYWVDARALPTRSIHPPLEIPQ